MTQVVQYKNGIVTNAFKAQPKCAKLQFFSHVLKRLSAFPHTNTDIFGKGCERTSKTRLRSPLMVKSVRFWLRVLNLKTVYSAHTLLRDVPPKLSCTGRTTQKRKANRQQKLKKNKRSTTIRVDHHLCGLTAYCTKFRTFSQNGMFVFALC